MGHFQFTEEEEEEEDLCIEERKVKKRLIALHQT